MTDYICKIRYTDDRGRSHNVIIESDLSDRRYIEDFIRNRYPVGKHLFINQVRQK